MMDFQPRKLPVFNRVERKKHYRPGCLKNVRQFIHGMALIVLNSSSVFVRGLGYEGKAVAVEK